MSKIKYTDLFDAGLIKQIEKTKTISDALLKSLQSIQTLSPKSLKDYKTATKQLTDTSRNYLKVKMDEETLRKKAAQAAQVELNNRIKIETQQKKNEVALKKEIVQKEKLKKKTADLNSLYKQESKRLTDLRNKAKDVGLQFGTTSKQFTKAKNEVVKLDAKLKKIDSSLGQNQRKVGKYGNAFKGVTSQLKSFVGVFALFSVLKNVTKKVMEFSKANSKLASILGETKKDIKDLTIDAKKLGASTAFSASQVVSLQIELAKLGFNKTEIKNSSKGILDLAAATGISLADAATLAGATLRSFGLDATKMGQVTDVLAASTSKSALDMSKLATALPIVGTTAKIAGDSFEETTAKLGILSNSGMDASTAATALRNIYLELSKKGLTWDKAMTKIANSTNKNKTAMELFGKRSASASIVLQENANDVEKLSDALDKASGTAKKMADEQLDNLAGDITLTKSRWEALVLSVEDGEGIITKSVRGMTSAFSGLLYMMKKTNDNSKYFKDMLSLWAAEIKGEDITQFSEAILNADSRIMMFTDKVNEANFGTKEYRKAMIGLGVQLEKVYGDQGLEIWKKFVKEKKKAHIEDLAQAKIAAAAAKAEAEAAAARAAAATKALEMAKAETEAEKERAAAAAAAAKAEAEAAAKAEVEANATVSEKEKEIENANIKAIDNIARLKEDALFRGVDSQLVALQLEQEIEEQAIRDSLASEEYKNEQLKLIDEKYTDWKILAIKERKRAELAMTADMLGQAASIFGEQTIAFKVLATAQAVINTYLAANAVMAQTIGGPLLRTAAVAVIIAAGLANVAKINNVKLADGEVAIDGKGNETSDDIPAMLSKGETVHTAKATKRTLNFHNALHDKKSDAALMVALSKDLGTFSPGMLMLNNLQEYKDDNIFNEMKINNKYLKRIFEKDGNNSKFFDKKGNFVEIKGGTKRITRVSN